MATGALLGQALGIWTCWALLSRSWPQSIVTVAIALTRSETALSSFVCFMSISAITSRHSFSATHDVTRVVDAMILIHLIIKGCSAHWTARFKDTELLLI